MYVYNDEQYCCVSSVHVETYRYIDFRCTVLLCCKYRCICTSIFDAQYCCSCCSSKYDCCIYRRMGLTRSSACMWDCSALIIHPSLIEVVRAWPPKVVIRVGTSCLRIETADLLNAMHSSSKTCICYCCCTGICVHRIAMNSVVVLRYVFVLWDHMYALL